MKNLLILLIILPQFLLGQTLEYLDVPPELWINDNNFENIISHEEDDIEVIVIEFWAEFNKDNSFKDWRKLSRLGGVKYYRIDIAKSPKLQKKFRIRMTPTLILYAMGSTYTKLHPIIRFKAKAGIDLLCPVDYPKMLKAIEIVKRESQLE